MDCSIIHNPLHDKLWVDLFSCLLLQRLLSQRLQWRFSCVTIMHDTHKKKRSMYYIYLEQRLIIPYHNEKFQLKCLLPVCVISKYQSRVTFHSSYMNIINAIDTGLKDSYAQCNIQLIKWYHIIHSLLDSSLKTLQLSDYIRIAMRYKSNFLYKCNNKSKQYIPLIFFYLTHT